LIDALRDTSNFAVWFQWNYFEKINLHLFHVYSSSIWKFFFYTIQPLISRSKRKQKYKFHLPTRKIKMK
jgi:hypothetical protein